MSSILSHGPESLANQCRHQARIDRQRMTWWLPLIFVIGCAVSLLGFSTAVWELNADGALTSGLFIFGLFSLLFGAAVVRWLIGPLPYKPRIVPYFAQQLGAYHGPAMSAFLRGRALYSQIVALDALADTLSVQPLSSFGFAYDHYDQVVQWHSAAQGLHTVQALRAGLGADVRAAPGLTEDLDTLAAVLHTAADQGVEFSLIVRLHAKDNMQAVCTRELRQGEFW
jgi:hypothetical protein